MIDRAQPDRAPRRVMYCEGNTDGTIGGSFYSLLYLVEGLDRLRYRPMVVFQRDNALIPTFRAADIETHVFMLKPSFRFAEHWGKLPVVGIGMRLVQKAANVWRRFVEDGVRCALFLRRHRIELAHLNNSIVGNHHWMLGALLAGTHCITHERGINAVYSRPTRFFAKRLDAIVCISRAVQASLDRGRVRYRRAVIIHNGLDVRRISAAEDGAIIRVRHGIPLDAPLIGIVGNIKEWKGQDVVVRACARLRERWPGIHCLMVGDTARGDEHYRSRIERMVSDLGLERQVVFTGYQKDVASYMNAMDVVVHASILPEPFGRVLIEAMALSKPLVAARDGAVTEIIVEGESGLTFSPGDDADLARQVERLLGDAAFSNRIANAGRRRVEEEFDIRQNVARTQSLYEEVLG